MAPVARNSVEQAADGDLAPGVAGPGGVTVGVEPIGTEYAFLDGVAEIVSASDYAPRESDRMVVVDCGDFSRIPEGMRGHAQKRIGFCIDHHKSNAGFAPLRLIEPTASSSAELVLSVLESGAFPVTRAAAEALWQREEGELRARLNAPAENAVQALYASSGLKTGNIMLVYGLMPYLFMTYTRASPKVIRALWG